MWIPEAFDSIVSNHVDRLLMYDMYASERVAGAVITQGKPV